jgi:hypothetical protein
MVSQGHTGADTGGADLLCADDAVEVGLHELLDEVDLAKGGERGRAEHVEDRDDILVPEVQEQADLAQRAQAEHRVVERRDALDRDLALRRQVHRRAAIPYAPSPMTSRTW